jgi:hypothetical protein
MTTSKACKGLCLAMLALGCEKLPLTATAMAPPAATASANLQSSSASTTSPTQSAESVSGASSLDKSYAQYLSDYQALDRQRLFERLGVNRRSPPNLGFYPTKAKYYVDTIEALGLTPQEQALYATNGFAVVDHGQRYSMGSLYHAIYSRDLPVLVTSDSILHALHRSFDRIVMRLEQEVLLGGHARAFQAMHERLAGDLPQVGDPRLLSAYRDVDLYLTVTRNLLEGGGALGEALDREPTARRTPGNLTNVWTGDIIVPSVAGQNYEVVQLLKKIQAQRVETPDAGCTTLRNHRHCIDYSQFIPRGHYTKTVPLQRYFRAMMWLGRADIGWNLEVPKPPDAETTRELRGAAVLALLAQSAGQLPTLQAMGSIVDLLVGPPDSLTLPQIVKSMEGLDFHRVEQLGTDEAIGRLGAAIAESNLGAQTIRSQPLAPAADGQPSKPPAILQLAGQRFIVDGFVLSKVVYDSIDYQGRKIERMLPTGLDVWAALGNDEAAHLLVPELDRHHYAPQLFSAREALSHAPSALWTQSLYASWLNTLRTLHGVPNTTNFPSAMRSQVWQKKQLHTQLASWAELRHDTVLYAKQSYSASTVCEYPMGYVEPYPEFFASLAKLATTTADRYEAALPLVQPATTPKTVARKPATAKSATPKSRAQSANDSDWRVQVPPTESEFLRGFTDTMLKLENLAKKELAGAPFTEGEQTFLKKTIDIRGGGSGPPRYDGWYARLFFNTAPDAWDPTVADVHTSPGPLVRGVLEEGVGNAQFLMIAIDNGSDHATYIGPVYSYYEFVVDPSKRFTDEEWTHVLETGATVARPKWTSAFIAPSKLRAMGRPAQTKP